jgi:hypothetical protein
VFQEGIWAQLSAGSLPEHRDFARTTNEAGIQTRSHDCPTLEPKFLSDIPVDTEIAVSESLGILKQRQNRLTTDKYEGTVTAQLSQGCQEVGICLAATSF